MTRNQLLYRVREAADLLGVSRMTVRRLIWRGELPVVLVGSEMRLRRVDLERYVARLAGETPAAPSRRRSAPPSAKGGQR